MRRRNRPVAERVALRSSTRRALQAILWIAGTAVGLGLYAAWLSLSEGRSQSTLLPLAISFGCVGMLLGAIYAFDSEASVSVGNNTMLRVGLSALAGLILALFWRWTAEGIVSSVVVFAGLGYVGMRWARYVDF
ncbi:hypothetical protein [Tahibacter amnicola]|uniref:Uncharacterized protein n=1 Tax=Tahibacter amnicola TaxID=2976241 RepID=A0ABY6B9W4_9GAMM|nr:hypothetical protein [Tahibacter amnicola]UXI65923.1 hypothetical protein N4264_14280 [Tahibacter amnicola]